MKYEIKNQRYSINDILAANALVVGFAKKITPNEILDNLNDIKNSLPILNSCLKFNANEYYFDDKCEGFQYGIEPCSNVNAWITKQYKNPLDLEKGEYLRIALYNENTLIIYAHNIISDSRGLVNFAKALLLSKEGYEFKFDNDEEYKINFLNQLATHKYRKLTLTPELNNNVQKVKIKKISLKSNVVFSLCSSQGVSLLSFFITVALSLSKSVRKELMIPFCSKKQSNLLLVNASSNIKFKRGLEPRLSFYDNCSQIDKLFKSFIKRKPFLLRNEILKNISPLVIDKPFSNVEYTKFLSSDLLFDVLPTLENDELITTLSYYPSSSFCSNSFGISIVDDKITICSVLHDKNGEELFSSYQQTINLLSKNADVLNK